MHDIIIISYIHIFDIFLKLVFIYIHIQTHANLFISIFQRKVPWNATSPVARRSCEVGPTSLHYGDFHCWQSEFVERRLVFAAECLVPTEEIFGAVFLWWKGLTRDCNRANFAVCDYIYIYLLFLFVVCGHLILHKLLCFFNKKGGSVCENCGFPARTHHV